EAMLALLDDLAQDRIALPAGEVTAHAAEALAQASRFLDANALAAARRGSLAPDVVERRARAEQLARRLDPGQHATASGGLGVAGVASDGLRAAIWLVPARSLETTVAEAFGSDDFHVQLGVATAAPLAAFVPLAPDLEPLGALVTASPAAIERLVRPW